MRPSIRFLLCAGAWLLLGVACDLLPKIIAMLAPTLAISAALNTTLSSALVYTWWSAGIALLLIALFDARLSRQQPTLTVDRVVSGVWPVDRWHTVTLHVSNQGQRTLAVDIFDAYPPGWALMGLPFSAQIAAGHFVEISYQLQPDRRGDAQFEAAHVKALSPLGLWQRVHRIGPTNIVKVFPDFSKLLGHTLSATDRRASSAGIVRKRRRGEGTDFRQLREYRQGDSQRSIDWKATARYQKPITREYQEERDQQVVFLLDTGRRMLAKDGDTSHLDHALNAVITLSFLVQKQGDAVGLMTFGGETRWLSPQKGRIGLDRILGGIYDLQAQEVAPDYTLAAQTLLSKLHKRAFVVFITNLRDEDDEAMRTACEFLSAKHLVMCASLREKALDTAVATPIHNFADALRVSATLHYLQQRQTAIKQLGIRASHLIDIVPEQLSMSLVNRYLDIKESGQL